MSLDASAVAALIASPSNPTGTLVEADTLRAIHREVSARGGTLLVRARDTGSGVDPGTVGATLDGRRVRARYGNGILRIPAAGLGRGRHRLVLQVSDYQETRNQENVPRILPNTSRLSAAFVVR